MAGTQQLLRFKESEVESLLAKGEGWLETHPARDAIVRRSLKHKGRLALERLVSRGRHQRVVSALMRSHHD